MALEDYFEPFIFMDYVSVSDGLGGISWEHKEGAPFMAGITTVQSDEVEVAYRQGMKTIYHITTNLSVELERNNVVKRVADGRLYRITSDAADKQTPKIATVKQNMVTAEVMS